MNLIPHNRPTIEKEEIDAAVRALSGLELTTGVKVKEFESRFSEYIRRDSIAVSSGTAALHLALAVLGVNSGDEVILPSYTCAAVAYPVLYQRAIPVLVDVGSDYNISTEEIKNGISSRTRAVIVPHMFGYPADIREIREICDEQDIFLIEDCAQAPGAQYDGKRAGTFGDISIFSFYATKMITSIQGGMICTDNKEWSQHLRDIRYHDQPCLSEDARLKYSYMMSDINAAIGIEQMKKLDRFITRRREIASIYRDEIINVGHPEEAVHKKHVYSRYVVRTELKDEIIRKLRWRNIICTTMHSPPLHRKILFASQHRGYPATDSIVESTVSLPIYPSLRDEEVVYIAENINRIQFK